MCGVYVRVEAHCAIGSSARCPGGAYAAGNADPTLCDGAPVYRQPVALSGERGPRMVLLRVSEGGGTHWRVSLEEALVDCEPGSTDAYPRSDLNPGLPGDPTAPAYGQWSYENHDSISMVAGGGR